VPFPDTIAESLKHAPTISGARLPACQASEPCLASSGCATLIVWEAYGASV